MCGVSVTPIENKYKYWINSKLSPVITKPHCGIESWNYFLDVTNKTTNIPMKLVEDSDGSNELGYIYKSEPSKPIVFVSQRSTIPKDNQNHYILAGKYGLPFVEPYKERKNPQQGGSLLVLPVSIILFPKSVWKQQYIKKCIKFINEHIYSQAGILVEIDSIKRYNISESMKRLPYRITHTENLEEKMTIEELESDYGMSIEGIETSQSIQLLVNKENLIYGYQKIKLQNLEHFDEKEKVKKGTQTIYEDHYQKKSQKNMPVLLILNKDCGSEMKAYGILDKSAIKDPPSTLES